MRNHLKSSAHPGDSLITRFSHGASLTAVGSVGIAKMKDGSDGSGTKKAITTPVSENKAMVGLSFGSRLKMKTVGTISDMRARLTAQEVGCFV